MTCRTASLFTALALVLVGSAAAPAAKPTIKPFDVKGKTVRSTDLWHGFERTKFTFNGRSAWIVKPSVAPQKDMPWTWTIQWAEAFVPRTGVPDLLAKGFHHVTLEAFDLRATEAGLAEFAAFQAFLVKELGFAPKANLVGMSWGGFFSVRYAAAYPQNVRRIYLDAPLLNFDGFAPDRIGPWAKLKPADGKWSDDPRMPVNLAAPLARTGIPVLLLYGGKDLSVPPDRNCLLFIPRFKAAGGKIDVVARPDFGHHPHGLDVGKTQKIVDFFSR